MIVCVRYSLVICMLVIAATIVDPQLVTGQHHQRASQTGFRVHTACVVAERPVRSFNLDRQGALMGVLYRQS